MQKLLSGNKKNPLPYAYKDAKIFLSEEEGIKKFNLNI